MELALPNCVVSLHFWSFKVTARPAFAASAISAGVEANIFRSVSEALGSWRTASSRSNSSRRAFSGAPTRQRRGITLQLRRRIALHEPITKLHELVSIGLNDLLLQVFDASHRLRNGYQTASLPTCQPRPKRFSSFEELET
jgi:hypothetical protein